ncbi:unnamed protein product [Heterobilharzia americana]|nr:unnamed protein product [Heterobilharzia americana]
MALRRRADILDPDFGTIRHQIAKLMQQSIHDCKSFLLMVKSLFPNSIKLEMIEYELMQEYGESSLAAEILCRLYEIHKHLDITQIQLLSNIIKDPSDKVCCEIFSKLIPSLQKDLTQSYFKQISNNLARADSIIFLLNSKDVVLHSQVIPMLLALANQSLLDGEYSMRKSSQMSNTYLRCHSPVQDGESFVKTENSDEGEEGEVIGCDDEDEFVDELDTSNAEAGESSLANIPISALNIFRFKVTYELLPIAYKTANISKLDKNLLYRMSVTSLNFLLTYIVHIPANPSVEGLERGVFLSKKDPKIYITDCLKMIGYLLQWPVNTTFDFTSGKSPSYLVRLTVDLFKEAKSSFESPSTKKDTRNKMLRQSGHKSVHSSLSHKSHAAVFQAVCVFWYTFVDLGATYLYKVRSRIFERVSDDCHLSRASYFPLNLDVLFNLSNKHVSSLESEEITLLKCVHEIWSLREYTSASYSLGNQLLDTLEDDIRPHFCELSDLVSETIFEQIIRLDFTLGGLNNNPHEMVWACDFVNKYCKKLYNSSEVTLIFRFLQKLTPLCPVKSKTAIESDACQGVWHDLVKEFRSVYLLLDQSKNKKIHLQNNCCLVPFTRPNIIFVVSKALASSLCAVAQETQDSFVTVRCICLACVLCQVDVMLGDTFHMETPWPSLFPYISEIMLTHWSDVRNRFSRWLLPPTALIFDVGLLNTMFQLECGIGVKIEWLYYEVFVTVIKDYPR